MIFKLLNNLLDVFCFLLEVVFGAHLHILIYFFENLKIFLDLKIIFFELLFLVKSGFLFFFIL